jgi:hypothetical protein
MKKLHAVPQEALTSAPEHGHWSRSRAEARYDTRSRHSQYAAVIRPTKYSPQGIRRRKTGYAAK